MVMENILKNSIKNFKEIPCLLYTSADDVSLRNKGIKMLI